MYKKNGQHPLLVAIGKIAVEFVLSLNTHSSTHQHWDYVHCIISDHTDHK